MPQAEPLTYSREDLARALGVGLATVDRMSAAGKLPRPLRISANRVAWLRTAIQAWLEQGCPDRVTFEARRGR